LANIYCNSNLPRIGIERAGLAIKLSKEMNNNYYLGISYLNKANCLYDLLSYDSAFSFFKFALTRLEKLNAPLLTGNCLSNMGNTLSALGKFTESITYYEKANEYYIKIGDNNRLANNYLNISSTKLFLFDFDGAIILICPIFIRNKPIMIKLLNHSRKHLVI